MRFLRWFVSLLCLLIGVGVGTFFLVREGLLIMAEQQLEKDIRFLQTTNTWSSAGENCQLKTGLPADRLQLRFLNPREYVLEVACGEIAYVPWSELKSLPWQVTKTTGSAGFVLPITSREASGEITLHLWGEDKVFQVDGMDFRTRWGKTDLISDSLVSSCTAHGLICCDLVHEIGEGNSFSRAVNDCQDSCYTQCLRRPNLLFFETDPALDAQTRAVVLSKQNTFVLFNYTFETNEADLQTVTLDFGDGTQETFSSPIGKATKTYDCQAEECRFTARISAVDTRGVPSPDLRINQLEIIVR